MADVDGVELAPFTVSLEQARIVREAIHIDPKHMAVVFGESVQETSCTGRQVPSGAHCMLSSVLWHRPMRTRSLT